METTCKRLAFVFVVNKLNEANGIFSREVFVGKKNLRDIENDKSRPRQNFLELFKKQTQFLDALELAPKSFDIDKKHHAEN